MSKSIQKVNDALQVAFTIERIGSSIEKTYEKAYTREYTYDGREIPREANIVLTMPETSPLWEVIADVIAERYKDHPKVREALKRPDNFERVCKALYE